jgi:hypothetical protein
VNALLRFTIGFEGIHRFAHTAYLAATVRVSRGDVHGMLSGEQRSNVIQKYPTITIRKKSFFKTEFSVFQLRVSEE